MNRNKNKIVVKFRVIVEMTVQKRLRQLLINRRANGLTNKVQQAYRSNIKHLIAISYLVHTSGFSQ